MKKAFTARTSHNPTITNYRKMKRRLILIIITGPTHLLQIKGMRIMIRHCNEVRDGTPSLRFPLKI